MTDSVAVVMRRSWLLWVGAGLLPMLNIWAGLSGHRDLLQVTLALTLVFALYGTGFGIWAGRKASRPAEAGMARGTRRKEAH